MNTIISGELYPRGAYKTHETPLTAAQHGGMVAYETYDTRREWWKDWGPATYKTYGTGEAIA